MLPMLKLQVGMEGKTRLMPAGGKHRLEAVKSWVLHLKKEYENLKKQRLVLEAQLPDDTNTMQIDEENDSIKPRRDALAETLALKGQWMVILYDHCKSHFSTLVNRSDVVSRISMGTGHAPKGGGHVIAHIV